MKLAGLTSSTLASLLLAGACRGTDPRAELDGTPEPLRSLLESRPALVQALASAEERRIQIVLGWFETATDGRSVLWQARFRAGAEYFYPASSVKTFAAVAALERLAELRRETGLAIDRDTPMELFPLFEGEKLEQGDATHRAGGTITVGHEIRKLAIVSDNEAFNRLYELVGQDGIAASMARAGLTQPRIVHRLDELRSAQDNRRYPRTDFVGTTFRQTIPARESRALQPPPPLPKLLVGKGYVSNEALTAEPMDFSGKNRISLVDLQRGLCKIVRPDADCGGGKTWALEPDDREFLLDAMTEHPSQSTDPVFDPKEHPDDSTRLLLPGLENQIPRERLRIVNKYGQAYGFTTENAWIEDRDTGRGLFLAATIYTNADGILNDDRYEYETVTKPFFEELGRAVGKSLREETSRTDSVISSGAMSQILVRKLEPDIKAKLTERARKHGRSTEAEAREILRTAVLSGSKAREGFGSWVVACFAGAGIGLDEPIAELRGFPARPAKFRK